VHHSRIRSRTSTSTEITFSLEIRIRVPFRVRTPLRTTVKHLRISSSTGNQLHSLLRLSEPVSRPARYHTSLNQLDNAVQHSAEHTNTTVQSNLPFHHISISPNCNLHLLNRSQDLPSSLRTTFSETDYSPRRAFTTRTLL
jgi:hypothetical protein